MNGILWCTCTYSTLTRVHVSALLCLCLFLHDRIQERAHRHTRAGAALLCSSQLCLLIRSPYWHKWASSRREQRIPRSATGCGTTCTSRYDRARRFPAFRRVLDHIAISSNFKAQGLTAQKNTRGTERDPITVNIVYSSVLQRSRWF